MYSVYSIIASASNIRHDDEHPDFDIQKFYTMYPQFIDTDDIVIQAWLNIAISSLSYARWGNYWEMGVSLYMAHFLTLYMQSIGDPDGSPMSNIEAGLARGVATSKSVSDMSISYDFGSIASEAEGWGTFKMTTFGLQFVQFAKLVSMGGMTVW